MNNRLQTRNKFMKSCKPLLSTVVTIGIISVCCQSAQAQLLFSEGFNYTPGNGLANEINPGNGLIWHNGNTSELQIGSGQLSYAGLQELPGYELAYTSSASASASYNTYSAVTSGSVYYSFLINCLTLPTANQYVSALNPGTTTPGGSGDAMSTYVGAATGGWKIGIRTPGGGSGGTFETTALALNTTYFVVEQLTLGSSPVVNLYLNPLPGGSQPGTADATQTGTTAVTSVDDIGFKVQSATTTGNFDFGNLLVGDTWADVTPAAVTVPEPNTLALLGGGMVLLQAGWRRLQKRD